VYDNYLEMY